MMDSRETAASYRKIDEASLILKAQADDQRAFQELTRRYGPIIHHQLRTLAPDWRDVPDLTQEALIRMWRNIKKLRNPRAFRSWCSRIVRNLFYDQLRVRLRRTDLYFGEVSLDAPIASHEDNDGDLYCELRDKGPTPQEQLCNHELTSVIRSAMKSLPQQFRVAIILREVEGLPYDEIACITNSEVGTVKSRIARARAKIQEIVAEYVQEAA